MSTIYYYNIYEISAVINITLEYKLLYVFLLNFIELIATSIFEFKYRSF